jgi:hypothetical protein
MKVHRCASCVVRTPSTYEKVKLFLTGRGNLEGYEKLMLPHCADNRFTDGGEVDSVKYRPRSTPQKSFYFCLVLISVRGPSVAEKIG